jgi:hypothetical protein
MVTRVIFMHQLAGELVRGKPLTRIDCRKVY